ncbi:S-adenosylmethionine:tRNA ribosyltransferase-isomerase [Thermotoga sp. Ku-13t]|uniref:tRNA preQ1(34) S-adenosylmethionine ribosyltransferase-isomerase QueA n=1 Tax=Thermotoga sp. Ku-13t TaxID=1755813 RepID=UPI0013ECE5A4|nr:tRNA preQ1(34) S-adenosylmethionine ribosyltransferase-isomerase QueA [Thermotoga sp. Ku-13t]KAF2957649.1 S-adenosylmethionine:tRNA ribosyltransferase-isomerase [Thermotoga sp. Ku-13t]
MKLSDFDYYLPEELIAQIPVEPRDSSRLMVVHRDTGLIEHRIFRDIIEYLKPGDVLVLNNSKVIPARLFGHINEKQIEILLVQKVGEKTWKCLVRPAKKFKPGVLAHLSSGIVAKCLDRCEEGMRLIEFNVDDEELLKVGEAPIPPYVKTKIPLERYQTVYAKVVGSIAAPTAGFHFTETLLEKIRSMGVQTVEVTLHVGIGTFRPVKTENIEQHRMHSEKYSIPPRVVEIIRQAKSQGHRIIAVGTTVVRTLESFARTNLTEGETDLFIYPPFEFKIVDALITNFHLPRSTLLMLVCAFAGHQLIMNAYQEAVKQRYRFYSFGDAMFIL